MYINSREYMINNIDKLHMFIKLGLYQNLQSIDHRQ